MIRALLDRGIRPDLIVGTSAGAVQGALLAADPEPAVLPRMEEFWHEVVGRGILRPDPRGALRSLRRGSFALSSSEPFQVLLAEFLGGGSRFEDLAIPLQTCAASIERATARYFDHGPLIPALLASCAIPGLFPPYRIGDEHYVDGGVVESAPITRALSLGAKTLFVLRLGQREQTLTVPRRPWGIGQVSFEISRRHHLGIELNKRPEGVSVHHLPSGEETLMLTRSRSKRSELAAIRPRIDEGYRAVGNYLDALAEGHVVPAPETPTGLGPSRAEERAPSSAQIAADLPVEVSAFLGGKLNRFIDLCDQNRDDAVAETDLLALGGRIAEAFGAQTGSLVHQRLESAFADFWTRIRAAAGLADFAAKSVRRPDFLSALARLTVDRAAYDEHVLPLIGSLLAAADGNGDDVLSPAEVGSLLRALGVADGDVHMFVLRVDTDDAGVVTLDELSGAFREFFTSEQPGAVGNAILGGARVG
jgi:predicted acylesterase/phospholipase RssA